MQFSGAERRHINALSLGSVIGKDNKIRIVTTNVFDCQFIVRIGVPFSLNELTDFWEPVQFSAGARLYLACIAIHFSRQDTLRRVQHAFGCMTLAGDWYTGLFCSMRYLKGGGVRLGAGRGQLR